MFAMRFKKTILYPFWRIIIFLIGVFSGQNPGYLLFCPFLQRCRTSGALVVGVKSLWLCFLCSLCGSKKHPPSVLANPYFLDWHRSGQNPEYLLFCSFLQRCRTSGALVVGLNLCDYVFYVRYAVQKKHPPSVSANPYFLDWGLFRQNPGYLLFCPFLQRCRTSGALVVGVKSMWLCFLCSLCGSKKNPLHPFWRILIFLIGVFSGQNPGYFWFCSFLQRCRTSGALVVGDKSMWLCFLCSLCGSKKIL